MKIETTIFRSKVARRIFTLFVCCALIPITALAVLSFRQVAQELKAQGHMRLQRAVKAVGMGIIERLVFLETELKNAELTLHTGAKDGATTLKDPAWKRFRGLAFVPQHGDPEGLYGTVSHTPFVSRNEWEQMRSGKTVVLVHSVRNNPPRVFMLRAAGSKNDPGKGFLLGEADPAYLFGVGNENTLPPMTELCVLDENNNIIVSSLPVPPPLGTRVGGKADGTTKRQFEWEQNGHRYLAAWWLAFLKSRFAAPNWTVVLSQSKSLVLAPMSYFKKIFPLVVLISFWVVLFLSIIQIRRNLVPLEQLKEGAQLLGQGLFDMRVTVTSKDEFQDLARAFNTMAGQLAKQFRTLKTRAEIDRAILSTLDTERIVETTLDRIPLLCRCDTVRIGVAGKKAQDAWRLYEKKPDSGQLIRTHIDMQPETAQKLLENRHCFTLPAREITPAYASLLAQPEAEVLLVLPIFVRKALCGVIVLGYSQRPGQNPDDASPVRDRIHKDMAEAPPLRDQIAVAFSNARLLDELEKLNWGALTALARTVDTKSPWTAGHSERVTKVALYIAGKLGLQKAELDRLRRAGLLHDIGKIGIPSAILDKPGKLTDEEYELIKTHPRLGERILQPIEAYADVIPIVAQHHEQFGGGGYPDGLAGEDICLGARILAVADVFDALASERPYRKGWDKKRVVDFIKKNAGDQFDPAIVRAFLKAPAKRKRKTPPPLPAVTPPAITPRTTAGMEQTP